MKRTMYALCLKDSTKTVMIEEGLFYGQPTESSQPQFIALDELNRLLTNRAFVANIVEGRCVIRKVEVSFGEVLQIEPVPPIPQETVYKLKE